MPGWKGLSWFYVWSWLQPATSAAGMVENGAPLPSPPSWGGRESAPGPICAPCFHRKVGGPSTDPKAAVCPHVLAAKGARAFLCEPVSQHLWEQGGRFD